LTIQADGQPEFEMGYDSAGDFYPLKFDALLRPKHKADGAYTFTWFQGGAVLEAERLGQPVAAASKWTPTEAQLADYIGDYPLMPNFGLRVSATGAKLFVQGTNQRSIEFVPVERDVFIAESVSAEIDFERDAGDKVVSLLSSSGGKSCAASDINARYRAKFRFIRRTNRRYQLSTFPGKRAVCSQ
jgi:hypothetical protein